ncbi:hypothetical protein ASPCAL09081 [Aspergillus calidoustus]|uniref:Uncharacterized protein n=1 Tax=Aspergillus calidoustus TaxID=454130 RepID=A0A0U5GTC3_ASPCI|nr:hypothetical protein ASPCAL09081 [Aspergillus calidoustus]
MKSYLRVLRRGPFLAEVWSEAHNHIYINDTRLWSLSEVIQSRKPRRQRSNLSTTAIPESPKTAEQNALPNPIRSQPPRALGATPALAGQKVVALWAAGTWIVAGGIGGNVNSWDSTFALLNEDGESISQANLIDGYKSCIHVG